MSSEQQSHNSLMWFRQDLRLQDNQALVAACEHAQQLSRRGELQASGKVRALFFATPKQWLQHDVAPIQIDFIERQLNVIAHELAEIGIPFDVIHVADFDEVPAQLAQYLDYWQIEQVFASSEPEFNERQRDRKVLASGIKLKLFSQHCYLPPLSVRNLAGDMYKVFTPFAKKWRDIAKQTPVSTVAKPTAVAEPLPLPSAIELRYQKRCSDDWQVGEAAAHKQLRQFARSKVNDYQTVRDFPAIDGTSQISAYLAIGILSPAQCLQAVLGYYPEALVDDDSPGRCWLNELIWREFYRHLLIAFPSLSKGGNFNRLADHVAWRNDPQEFQAWCEGRTGYPLVDAAMRQLNQTGWMHNRLRMVTASFLTKHLLVDWRWGERYFKQNLIDGDLAANNGGWQWSAGTGCDAQPYFRVFNPISQCEKFDPSGAFIRKYLPELDGVELKLIHKLKIPFQAQLFGCVSYFSPIVEHKLARSRAIAQLSVMKRGATTSQATVSSSSQRVQQTNTVNAEADLDKEIFG